MRTLDWESILRPHPVFEVLDDAQRTAIQDPEIAHERHFEEGERIVQQGELGNSIFLIGRGSAKVILERPGEETVELYAMGENEIFGEMALLENRPRAATLVADQRSILLEIEGDRFLSVLRNSADVGLVLLQKMSRRLSVTNGMINDQRLCDHEEAIALLKNRIESTVGSFEKSLEASKTINENTDRRANEIIDSADRARNRTKWTLSIAASVLALMAGLGLWDVKQMRAAVKEDRAEIQQDREAITALRAELEAKRAEIDAQQAELKAAQADMDTELNILRTAAQRVRAYAENAEAEHRTEIMLAELGNLEFSPALKDALATELNRFDLPTVQRIGVTLANLLRRDKAFHSQLAPLLEDERVTNADGKLFLTYYSALSALSEGASTQVYATHKSKLENMVMLSADPLTKPGYVSHNSGLIFKASLGRAAPDEDEKAARSAEVEELMALIALIKDP